MSNHTEKDDKKGGDDGGVNQSSANEKQQKQQQSGDSDLVEDPSRMARRRRRLRNNFANAKNQCLGLKRDKSSAGRIDPRAVEICALLNEQFDCYYTTSSCAGRCFLYQGRGVKSSSAFVAATTTNEDDTDKKQQHFVRFRVSHDLIKDALRYFDLSTLEADPSGGGDPIPSIGQYDHKQKGKEGHQEEEVNSNNPPFAEDEGLANREEGGAIWLRFEPFILHVACRSLAAAGALMAAARPAFKNVGLTTWNQGRFLVAIWGDEGLDMPLTLPFGAAALMCGNNPQTCEWLASLVNERHERNWEKIDRFVQAVRDMPAANSDDEQEHDAAGHDVENENEQIDGSSPRMPRSYDIVGDIAILHSLPPHTKADAAQEIGQALLHRQKSLKIVALRQSNLQGPERAAGALQILAGQQTRSPLITTHAEYGIKCVVDVEQTFFSPRMAAERRRLCQQVARGEHVLVLFCGVAMDALQLAGRTEAASIAAIESNPVAVTCAHRSLRMLQRNKSLTQPEQAAQRLEIIQGNVLEVLPTLPRQHYHRIVAPRPKEGAADGDLAEDGGGGQEFLEALLPVLRQDGGECHWYDFVADHEYPQCQRTRDYLQRVGAQHSLQVQILHVAKAGSVAMRQWRVCVDFKVSPQLIECADMN